MKNYEVNLLIGGRRVDVYSDPQSLSDLYIEGREGSSYQIQLVNNTWSDAEFVVSVDGLSIITGKPAGRDSEGYIVRARSSWNIDGWLVDNETAATFTFGAVTSSYSAQSGQGASNVGVIGALVFTKRVTYPTILNNSAIGAKPSGIRGFSKGIDTSWSSGSPSILSAGLFGSADASSIANASASAGPELSAFEYPEEVTSLGTEFGAATLMKTTKVSFTRASSTPVFEQVLHYATAKELNKLGITLAWQKKPERVKPNAFPADYCTPPAGWEVKK